MKFILVDGTTNMYRCDACRALVLDLDTDLMRHQRYHRDQYAVADGQGGPVHRVPLGNIVDRVRATPGATAGAAIAGALSNYERAFITREAGDQDLQAERGAYPEGG